MYFTFNLFSVAKILAIIRSLIVLAITLQWSLCMHFLDRQISEIKYLLKSSLESNSDPHYVGSTVHHCNVRLKKINMRKFETVIKVYRMITEKHRHLSDYYGIHMALNFLIMLYSSVLSAYLCWYKISHVRGNILCYFVLLKRSVDFINILLIAAICEDSKSKVRQTIFIQRGHSSPISLYM